MVNTKKNFNISNLTKDNLEKLRKIVFILHDRISISSSGFIEYIPIRQLPNEVSEFELTVFLKMLRDDFNVLKYKFRPVTHEIEIRFDEEKAERICELDTFLEKKLKNIKLNGKNSLNGEKIDLKISQNYGVFIDNEKNYPIKGKRFKLINALRDGKKDLSTLCTIQKQERSLIINEIRKINETFRTKLKQKNNLIIHVPTGGYELNNISYKINFLT